MFNARFAVFSYATVPPSVFDIATVFGFSQKTNSQTTLSPLTNNYIIKNSLLEQILNIM